MQLLRKLKIYDLTSIANSDIIELYSFYEALFDNLHLSINDQNNSVYTKNNNQMILIDVTNKNTYIDYDQIWRTIKFKTFSLGDTIGICKYFTYKLYKINIDDHTIIPVFKRDGFSYYMPSK